MNLNWLFGWLAIAMSQYQIQWVYMLTKRHMQAIILGKRIIITTLMCVRKALSPVQQELNCILVQIENKTLKEILWISF